MSTLKPGPYKATVRGVPDTTVLAAEGVGDNERWVTAARIGGDFWHRDSMVTGARPLIVLDPTAPHTAKMLVETLNVAQARIGNSAYDGDRQSEFIEHLQWLINAIEAQTKPARIPEPGLWGVVSALIEGDRPVVGDLNEWVKRIDGWHCPIHGHRPWDDLIDPVLIRHGLGDEL